MSIRLRFFLPGLIFTVIFIHFLTVGRAEENQIPLTTTTSQTLGGYVDSSAQSNPELADSSAHPANDNFANREAIVGTNILASLAGATSEPGEPMLEGISTGQTAWWTWTAPSNGIVTLNVSATNFNPLVTAFTGNSLENLSLIASNNYLACYSDTNCGCHWRTRSEITFHVQKEQSYQIAIDSALFTDTSYVSSSEPTFPITTLPPIPPPSADPNLPNVIVKGNQHQSFNNVWSQIQETNILAGDTVNLRFNFTPAPINDDLAKSIKLRGSRTHLTAKNFGATKQVGEPIHAGNSGGSSVWYSWTASAAGRVTISANDIPPYLPPTWGSDSVGVIIRTGGFGLPPTCGDEIDQNPPPQFFPVFAAYTGSSIDSLVSANALPLSLDAFPHAVEFDVVKGRTYQIVFDGNEGTTGETPLYLAFTKPASNDNFEKRIATHGINVVATGHNAGATRQVGEPDPQPDSTGKSVWWSWRAPVDGSVTIDVSASDYHFPVSVFIGKSLSSLQTVARSTTSPFNFDAVAGQTYQISVEDFSGLTGAIKLRLEAEVFELPLLTYKVTNKRTFFLTYPVSALLTYSASPGQIILLQRSTDENNWTNVQTATAHRNTVEFLLKNHLPNDQVFYRAIIIDSVAR